MGVVGQTSLLKRDRFWKWVFISGLLIGLALRLALAGVARMPGHGDSAFYYSVAKNIVDGRGVVLDYITYYFNGLEPISHYAGDFWNPTASLLLSLPMFLLGKSVFHALLASILAGLIPAIAGYLAGKHVSGSTAYASLIGLLTFFSPFQVWFSVTTEAIIFYGAAGSLALYLISKEPRSFRSVALAAGLTGLTNLIRQDGVLLFFTLEVCLLLAPIAAKQKLFFAVGALAIHLLVLSPLLVTNYVEMHTFFPAGPGKTVFLTTYEDFHSYNKDLSWQTLRSSLGITGIVKGRLHTALENLNQVNYFLDPVYTILLLCGTADLLLARRDRNKIRFLLPSMIFALFEYLFYSLIASFSGPGSLIKSLGVLMPFFCLVIIDLFSNLFSLQTATLLSILLMAYSGYRGFEKNYISTTYYNGIYQEYGTLKDIVTQDVSREGGNPDNTIIMARDTWDVYEGTGFKTLMIPNNNLATIYQVAQHYQARYLLLPAPRPALDKIYKGLTPDPRFTFIAEVPGTDWKVYRISP